MATTVEDCMDTERFADDDSEHIFIISAALRGDMLKKDSAH
jgi:hypothetical protein